MFSFLRTLHAGETEKQNLTVLSVSRYDIEPFQGRNFPLGRNSIFAFLFVRHGSTVHKYAYASCSQIFPRPLKPLFLYLSLHSCQWSAVSYTPLYSQYHLKHLFCLCFSIKLNRNKLRFNTSSTYRNRKTHLCRVLCYLVLLGLLLFQGLYS